MELSDLLEAVRDTPNAEQREAIEHVDGPLRIIAGPGSGKTHVLVLRTLNLIACHDVDPSRIVVITFTEKAAAQLEDRIRVVTGRLENPPEGIAELNVGTIHWFCGTVLRRHHPEIRRFEPLDQLGQQLFIYRRLDGLCRGLQANGKYLGKWGSKARASGELCGWFNKISEEIITAEGLQQADVGDRNDELREMLGVAYDRYRAEMREEGYLDFSLILRELYDLLQADTAALEAAREEYSHFMIDEYQDTNYVQEEIILKLAAPGFHVAVVGDDDQSLYRFRGATVRNILEFPGRLEELGRATQEVELEINYRSHPEIIQTYLGFMEDGRWTYDGTDFRTAHVVRPDPNAQFEQYPATAFLGGTPRDLADTVEELVEHGAVEDPSQIALLFHSVSGHAGDVIHELRSRGIDCYAPRAGRYLDHEEVRWSVGLLWSLLGFDPDDDTRPTEGPVADTCDWAVECWSSLERHPDAEGLVGWIEGTNERIQALEEGKDLSASLLDLLYRAFGFEPFKTAVRDPVRARNLAQFTALLRTFQQQFRIDVIHAGNRDYIPWRLWSSFFYLLQSGGVDEIEGEDPPPRGMVQVMTIHQAKGLEFPVVIVGSLDKGWKSDKQKDRVLGPLYQRGPFEPQGAITEFDGRREYYVAFSRAEHLLIAYSEGRPHRYFEPLAGRLPLTESLSLEELASRIPTQPRRDEDWKPTLSLTAHIDAYRRCARQYRLFHEDGFSPSFAQQVFFGTVVHQTIEDIHRHVLDGREEDLTEEVARGYFDRNSELLRKRGIHPLAPSQRDAAFTHVIRYLKANQESLDRVLDTEVEVTEELDRYVLNGRVDLIRGDDDAIEMIDFKAQQRRDVGEEYDHYRDQLAFYWHLLRERYGRRPDRAVLYFTGEDQAESARVEVDLSKSDIDDVIHRFDETAQKILGEEFELGAYPPRATCRACDFKFYCDRGEGGAA